MDVGRDRHFRISKSEHLAGNRIIATASRRSEALQKKRRLAKFNGVKQNFELHLKEREWRYNQALPQLIAGLKRLVAKNKKLMG